MKYKLKEYKMNNLCNSKKKYDILNILSDY